MSIHIYIYMNIYIYISPPKTHIEDEDADHTCICINRDTVERIVSHLSKTLYIRVKYTHLQLQYCHDLYMYEGYIGPILKPESGV